jgi:D-serine deaminase-like pyridoxal phosphate-dependent protein
VTERTAISRDQAPPRPTSLSSLDTPVLTADLDLVERNIAALQGYCDEHGLDFRPHIKTHKLPEIARMQVDAGAG